MHRSSLVAAALALCACAPAAPLGAPTPERAARIPMDVRLYEPQPVGFPFTLSRPGYVAIFEVVPDAGVGLVYPARFAMNEPFAAGAWWATAFNPAARWSYQSVSYFRSARPTFYYAIASTRPLRLEPLLESPMAMRRLLGFQRFASATPSRQLLSLLASEVLPADIQDDEWAADVYVRWPDPTLLFGRVPEVAWMRCPDGRVIAVPAGARAVPCAAYDARRDSARTPAPTDSGAHALPPDSGRSIPRPNPPGDGRAPLAAPPHRIPAVITADRLADEPFGLHPAIGDRSLRFESEERVGGVRRRAPRASPYRGPTSTGVDEPFARGSMRRPAPSAEPAGGSARTRGVGEHERDARPPRPVDRSLDRPTHQPVERPIERQTERPAPSRPEPSTRAAPARESSPPSPRAERAP